MAGGKADSVRTLLYANRAEKALRGEFPEIQWLFFEPDVED